MLAHAYTILHCQDAQSTSKKGLIIDMPDHEDRLRTTIKQQQNDVPELMQPLLIVCNLKRVHDFY